MKYLAIILGLLKKNIPRTYLGKSQHHHFGIARKLSTHTINKNTYDLNDSEDLLTKVFDSQKYFTSFNKSILDPSDSSIFNSVPKVGLFQNEYLSTPNGLIKFSKDSLQIAKNLVYSMNDEVNKSEQGRLNYIKKLDQLSDILCRVIDVAEFIRVVHPSQKWINAAQQTHEIMFEYMNQLNTNVDLYINVKSILEDPTIISKLTDEEIQVGEYLKQDFERSGIHMDPSTRDNFVAITQDISLLGSHFNNEVHNLESFWCEISNAEFDSIKNIGLKNEIKTYQSKYKANDGKSKTSGSIFIPLAGHIPYSILLDCETESIRKKVWISLHNSSKEQIQTLNGFIKYRALLSNMLEYKSFAHYQLEHKMAKNPENVLTFLKNIQHNLKIKQGGVIDELKMLYKFKENYNENLTDDEIIIEIKPWDRDYLLNKLQQQQNENQLESNEEVENISNYLSIGTMFNGLNELFKSIYNVALIPEPAKKGETWDHNQVRKISVFNLTTNKKLGYLYIDFWSPKVLPSHFTIVCSRKLNEDIGSETLEKMSKLVHLDEDSKFQLPVISLICNFAKPTSTTIGRFAGIDNEKPTLLSLDQVDTIFHEMGHAMHSMIGKTDLHNLSGTRCLTDFVELPSVLMESFSKDPRVICKIAKHYETGELLPKQLFKKFQNQKVILDQCETFMQSKMAMLDQVLHNEDIIKKLNSDEAFKDFDTTPIYHQLEKDLKVFSDEWSTWHGKFPHLFSYGAVYYSYLLDRAIADKVWNGLFKTDPWSREAGEKYKSSILKWGGTRDPWVCLADALNDDNLVKGDAKAMEIIGKNI